MVDAGYRTEKVLRTPMRKKNHTRTHTLIRPDYWEIVNSQAIESGGYFFKSLGRNQTDQAKDGPGC